MSTFKNRAAATLSMGIAGVLGGSLLAGATPAGPVFAADHGPAGAASGVTAYRPTAPHAVAAAQQAAAATPCWTSFNPGHPNGGPMDQTYNDCGKSGGVVAPAYTQSGNIHAIINQCVWVDPAEIYTWHLNSTVQGATYTTITCETE